MCGFYVAPPALLDLSTVLLPSKANRIGIAFASVELQLAIHLDAPVREPEGFTWASDGIRKSPRGSPPVPLAHQANASFELLSKETPIKDPQPSLDCRRIITIA